MDQTKPDWEISELYQKSWEIIKRYKVLWIFGMAATAGGASFGNSFNNASDFSNFDKFQPNTIPSDQISQVLGATTTSPFTETMSQIIGAIPVYFYLIFAVEVILAVIYFWGLAVIKSAWSQAALIHSIKTSLDGNAPTIRNSSQQAFTNIKSLAWLQVVPALILILVSLVVFFGIAALLVLGSGAVKLLMGIILLISIGLFIYAFIYLSLSQIWASKEVVLNNKGGKAALVSGYHLAKRKFWAMILLGLVNTILSMFILIGPTLIMAGAVFLGISIFQSNAGAGIGLIFIGGLLFVIFMIVSGLISGILTAFKESVWTIAYTKVKHLID